MSDTEQREYNILLVKRLWDTTDIIDAF